MGEQAVKNRANILQIIKNSKMDLQDYFLRWTAYAHYDALFKGFSDNIIAPSNQGGFGSVYTERPHPNYYVAGYGKVTTSDYADYDAYNHDIAVQLDALSQNGRKEKLTVSLLESMIAEATNLKIQRAVVGPKGDRYFLILIDNVGAFQLMQDPDWREIQMNAAARGEEINKLFLGRVEGFMSGAYILVDETIPGATVSGVGDAMRVSFGTDNPMATPVDTSNIRHAVLLGASAIAVAHALPVQFKSETWEFERHKEDAGIMIAGWNRVDIYDKDGYFGVKGKFKENVSSMVMAYYSEGISFSG